MPGRLRSLPSAPPCPPRGPLQLPRRPAASKLPPRSTKVSGRTPSGTCSPTTRLARLRQFLRKRGPHGCRCPRRATCRRPSAWRAQRRPSPRPWVAMGEGRRVLSCLPSPSGLHQQRSTVIAALAGLTGPHAGRAAVVAASKAATALRRPAARQAVPREGGAAGPPSVFVLLPVEGASMLRPLLQRLAAVGPPPSRGHLGAAGAQLLNADSTMGMPETRNRKHTTTVRTKAMTWFLVAADRQAPMARNAPAIRRLPR